MELLINAVLVLVCVGVVFSLGVVVYISAGIILMDCRERRAKKEAKKLAEQVKQEAEANTKAILARLYAKRNK